MSALVLVTGGTGKTGRRVAQRLRARGVAVRAVSRSTDPALDWTDEGSWEAVLDGVDALYLAPAEGSRATAAFPRDGPRRRASGGSCCSPPAA